MREVVGLCKPRRELAGLVLPRLAQGDAFELAQGFSDAHADITSTLIFSVGVGTHATLRLFAELAYSSFWLMEHKAQYRLRKFVYSWQRLLNHFGVHPAFGQIGKPGEAQGCRPSASHFLKTKLNSECPLCCIRMTKLQNQACLPANPNSRPMPRRSDPPETLPTGTADTLPVSRLHLQPQQHSGR